MIAAGDEIFFHQGIVAESKGKLNIKHSPEQEHHSSGH